mgnify:CR=1 FL=1
MADVHTKAQRSYNMSQIKGKNTKPELLVRKFLFANGYRYKLHDKKLPGKPDIVLPKYKTVIFINLVPGSPFRNLLKLTAGLFCFVILQGSSMSSEGGLGSF